MVLLVLGMVICYVHRGAMSVAAPMVMKELGWSSATVGIILSAFFWSYAFLQVPAGWLVDRIGPRGAYAWGFLLATAAFGLTGFFMTLVPIVALRILLGAGQSVIFPASARSVADRFQDRERGTVNAAYLMGVRAGQALIGYVAVSFILAYGWRSFFVFCGFVPLLWIFPWNRFWRAREASQSSEGAPEAPPARRATFLESIALLKQKTVLGIFLGFFAYDYAWFVYVSWLPGYLVMERGFTVREMGIYSSAPYVAMLFVVFFAGVASDWLIARGRNEPRVRCGFIVAGLAIGCLIVPAGMAEDKMTSLWLIIISLCGLGLATPNTWALTQAVCARHIVGTVSGIQNFGGNLGGILAPLVTGFIAHWTGSFALALGLSGIILLGGIAAYLLLITSRVEFDGA